MSKFHTRLKKLRIDSGYTQEQLAKKLGITKSRLGMYEIGQRNPDFETLELIADFFNVDMNYLLGKSSTKQALLQNYDVDIERKDNFVNLSDKELKLIHNYNLLNNVGKIEAQKRIEELTLIDVYST